MKTAVEWLVREFRKNRISVPMEMEQQAKEMEKEQITDAYYDGSQDLNYKIGSAEQYYNETFKTK
jgi:HEPN domain-containing protein